MNTYHIEQEYHRNCAEQRIKNEEIRACRARITRLEAENAPIELDEAYILNQLFDSSPSRFYDIMYEPSCEELRQAERKHWACMQ